MEALKSPRKSPKKALMMEEVTRLLLLPADISPEPVDEFSKFKRCLKTEKALDNFYRIHSLNLCFSKIYFQLEFSCYCDFQVLEDHLKSFVLEILFLGCHSSTSYLFDDKV